VSFQLSERAKRVLGLALLGTGLLALLGVLVLLRFAYVTDYVEHGLVKDPERRTPNGRVIVAPADGTLLYVQRVEGGVIPEVVKRGVRVPLTDHFKTASNTRFPDGYLLGIFMSWTGVHVNRVPISGVIERQAIFNGPHMDMSDAERAILWTQLIPGWVSLKKLLGRPPYDLADKAEFVLKSARETLVIRDARDTQVYVVRIADYGVGKILTWVSEGEAVHTGQRLGMIVAGSQTDVFFADTPGLRLRVDAGEYVYGAETVLATY
jgi:phosphatidylserine decarboxylase